jgi:isocitrate dehydrogenase (NAD+)
LSHRVTLISGDGIGPEVIEAARGVIEATGVSIDWERRQMGLGAISRAGDILPPETVASIRANRVAFKGPVETPVISGSRSVNVTLRKELDLFANVRPCKLYPGVPSVYERVDLVIVRENTEGMYTGFEFEMGTAEVKELIRFIEEETGNRIREDSGISIKAISEHGSDRIVRFAFGWAYEHGRHSITAGHKANIMKFTDGLFLEVARRLASENPDVAFDERIIDALCMQLVQAPERFDVLVLPNLYGDIASELGAGLIGGVGMAPGGHFGGSDGRELAVFEATHGTAPRLAGSDSANPFAAMLSGAMLLRHIGETEAGNRLEAAIADQAAEGVDVTRDLRSPGDDRPPVGTARVAAALVGRL